MESQLAYAVIVGIVVVGSFIARRRNPTPRAIQRYARARGLAMVRPWQLQLVRHGVIVRVEAIIPQARDDSTDVTTTVLVPSGLRVHHADDPTWSAPVDGAAAAWATIHAAHPRALAACRGRAVLVRVPGAAASDDVLDAMIELASRLARWDDGLSEALHALPGASPLEEHELDPAVVLAPDDLIIGVRGGRQLVAQLAAPGESRATARIVGDGDDGDVVVDGELAAPAIALLRRVGTAELLVTPAGARLTWEDVERAPTCLRAGVDALRAIRPAAGPYR